MLFKKSNKQENRNVFSSTDAEFARALGIEVNGISPNKMKEVTMYTCIRILSDTVSKLPLKIYKETDKGTEKASSHYLYQMLKLRPNKNMSSSDFWKTVEYQRNYFGHSVVVIETLPNGKVKALHPLNMANVEIWYDNAQVIGKDTSLWYVCKQVVGGVTKEFKFRSDEVLHFKGMTSDGITGMAIKDYLATTIENLQYGTDFTNKHFSGGLQAKGLLQYTGDIDEAGMSRLKTRFEKMATGMDNVGKILPVPVGFTFSTINSTMADSQFFEMNNLSIRQIASAFGIKQHMINDLSGAKFNNVQQQNEEFYRDTLHPIFTMYEQELTYKLLTQQEVLQGHFFQFNVDAILRTDLKTRYEAYNIGIQAGFLTPNEARAKEDMVNAGGGDELIVNGSMVKLTEVGAAYGVKETQVQGTDEAVQGGE